MSGDKYFINDQHGIYFLTVTVVNWIGLFTRIDYRDIIVDSLNYCVKHKGLIIYAWVIMSNHLHLVCQTGPPHRMSDFLRDFKKFTSKEIIRTIKSINESRKSWMLNVFRFMAKATGRARDYKVWRDDNHAIDLSIIDMVEKINYVHENPVRAGWVDCIEHYLYSSAIDYSGGKGLVKVVIV